MELTHLKLPSSPRTLQEQNNSNPTQTPHEVKIQEAEENTATENIETATTIAEDHSNETTTPTAASPIEVEAVVVVVVVEAEDYATSVDEPTTKPTTAGKRRTRIEEKPEMTYSTKNAIPTPVTTTTTNHSVPCHHSVLSHGDQMTGMLTLGRPTT